MNKKILFLGVGGIGVSALAFAAKKLGASVDGYDVKLSNITTKLANSGINIYSDLSVIKVTDYNMIVYSSAISYSNHILIEANMCGIPVLQRAMFLAVLMKDFKTSIAVTGTHGKTTTSSILASVLYELDSTSSFVIGGMVKSTNSNIEIRGQSMLVLEADESDASFLYLNPNIAIVTNIDLDHMSTYANCYDHLLEKFYEFVTKSSVETIVLCIDDKGCQDLLSRYDLADKKVITYGFCKQAYIRVSDYVVENDKSKFTVNGEIFSTLLPGKYNVLNALAAIIACLELGFNHQNINRILENVHGVARRFDIYNIAINGVDIDVIDDYGHHPVEVLNCISAVRDRYPNKKIIHIFQPHRYSRNRDLFDDWAGALKTTDKLLLLPTYCAGEVEIIGYTSKDIASKLSNCQLVTNFDMAIDYLKKVITDECVVLIQGAGDVTNIVDMLKNDK